MGYPFQEIEKKWQTIWATKETYKVVQPSDKPKYYVLDMFPYPSGAGLHVGHPLGYIASDIVARYKRHSGFNVLHPQGYDSFGLPAEQYAIQTGQHPAITTETNIKRYREQLDRMGFSFDWSRELRTSDPSYYRWTQSIFSLLFDAWFDKNQDKARGIAALIGHLEKYGTQDLNAVCDEETPSLTAVAWQQMDETAQEQFLLYFRLTYLAETEVNWCPALGTVLANDEVIQGVSERGGHPVERKKMKQWSMRISAYAERLLQGLDDIDWPEPLKEMQRNWIGKSVGARVHFPIENSYRQIEVFTTRVDTLFGVTFLTLAPEHEWVDEITTDTQREAVVAYVSQTAQRSERERISDVSRISGVFTGAYATHPVTNKKVPIWIADYVLAGYGTGAVMAVPCGDQRDFDFAKHFELPINNIFKDVNIDEAAFSDKEKTVIANSDFLDGLSYIEASQKIIKHLGSIGMGEGATTYRLRDAVFSRQRYWGEPIPIYFVEGLPRLIPDDCLPLKLPEVSKYLPTSDGAPPLGNATNWAWDTKQNRVVSNELIDDKHIFPLEKNTMPGWAGSSWYFNRFMDAQNTQSFVGSEALNYWKEVDLYLGGSEHATGHLLYSRFWQYFMYDMELVPVKNYAKKLINQGMILGESAFVYRLADTQTYLSKGLCKGKEVIPVHVDVSLVSPQNELNIDGVKKWQPHFANVTFKLEGGKYIVGRELEKMSKSKHNVVNPDAICDQYGADTLRMYEMFLGPIEQDKPWNTAGISGVSNFLNKFWRLFHQSDVFSVSEEKPSKESLKILNKTIDKVTHDIEAFSLNTSVSAFMIATNELTSEKCNQREILEPLTILLAPFAPHICEELWMLLGNSASITTAAYPIADPIHLEDDIKQYPISFNGKMRFKLLLSTNLSKDEIEVAVMHDERTKTYLDGKMPKNVIIIPKKIVNIVI
ncbi:MAG: leucine--tRNA ligase [Flavobacteriaceae bacterium]|nr:leucine--tRNA ligase [Flavobacteriaceae bacterium]|tara:strand:- start:7463 stop:10276 length:2814 start_codon:yes stop_codon:yes gene_type:complete